MDRRVDDLVALVIEICRVFFLLVQALLERCDALGDVSHKVGNLAPTEEKNDDDGDDDDLPDTDLSHIACSLIRHVADISNIAGNLAHCSMCPQHNIRRGGLMVN